MILLVSLFFIFFPNLSRIDSNGWGGRIPLVFMLLPPFILPEFIFVEKEILSGNRHKSLSPGFGPTMIFHCFLGLNFICSSMDWLTSSEELLISLLYVKTRL